MADRKLVIKIYRADALVRQDQFDAPAITIGSGADAALRLESPEVGVLHGALNMLPDGSAMLVDFGTETGINVGGARVPNARLAIGDSFEIGLWRMVLANEVEVIPPPAPPKPEPAPAPAAKPAPTPAVAAAVVEDTDHGHGHGHAEEDDQEPLAFIARSDTGSGKKVLEVNHVWGMAILDTRHYVQRGRAATVGSEMGQRWRLLGSDMGWVPDGAENVLPYFPPVWSEVNADWRADFFLAADRLPNGAAEFEMVTWQAEEATAHIVAGWDAIGEIGGRKYSLNDLVKQGRARPEGQGFAVTIAEDLRLTIDAGTATFVCQLVQPGKRVISRSGQDLDYPFLGIFSLVFLLGVLTGVTVFFSEKPPEYKIEDIPDRFVKLMLEKPIPPEEQVKVKKKEGDEGAKAKEDEGKVGKKDAKVEKAKGEKRPPSQASLDKKAAENAGLLGAIGQDPATGGVFSGGLNSSLSSGIGGLIGAKGTQFGAGGLGSRGSGIGGGGTADGMGGLGVRGGGGGASGRMGGGGGGKSEGAISRVGGDPIIIGGLERSLIDEVVKRHMSSIRYCYQRELTKDPSLNGKIVIKFTIAKDGSVSASDVKSSTIGNGAVESCVKGRFLRMQFPEPKGGGIVIVSYPFIFAPG
jgi:hypothetical protein